MARASIPGVETGVLQYVLLHALNSHPPPHFPHLHTPETPLDCLGPFGVARHLACNFELPHMPWQGFGLNTSSHIVRLARNIYISEGYGPLFTLYLRDKNCLNSSLHAVNGYRCHGVGMPLRL